MVAPPPPLRQVCGLAQQLLDAYVASIKEGLARVLKSLGLGQQAQGRELLYTHTERLLDLVDRVRRADLRTRGGLRARVNLPVRVEPFVWCVCSRCHFLWSRDEGTAAPLQSNRHPPPATRPHPTDPGGRAFVAVVA